MEMSNGASHQLRWSSPPSDKGNTAEMGDGLYVSWVDGSTGYQIQMVT